MSAISHDEWAQTLATHEPDRYVSTFFAPSALRPHLIALYAFDHEVSRIAYAIREPMAGQIRLAWWREQVDAIYSARPVASPVLVALRPVIERHALPRQTFDTYIDARARDLDEQPFADEEALLAYAASVHSPMFQLAARILGAETRADTAATAAGIATACAATLREFAHWRSHRRCRLPMSWLDCSAEDVFAGQPDLTPAFNRLKTKIKTALRDLNASRFSLQSIPALAPATCARWQARNTFDPWAPQPTPPWHRVTRLTLANLLWRV